MMIKRSTLICFMLILFTGISYSSEMENYIRVKGDACTIVKPDIAHCFFLMTGIGNTYDSSFKAAKNKMETLKTYLKETNKTIPEITILQITNKPHIQSIDFDQNKNLTDFAKAMKGEIPTPIKKEELKEYESNMRIYFTLPKFDRDSILSMMSSLAEKNIAFEKTSKYDFEYSSEYSTGKSFIYFGLTNHDAQIATLSSEAYKKAEHNAEILARTFGKKLIGLVNLTGCGDLLEGDVSLPEKMNQTGTILGPLSSDPARLVIRFSKDFGFKFI